MSTIYRPTIWLIAAVQFILGAIMLVPGLFEGLIGLEDAPGWVDWLFAMFGARAIGYGVGMSLAARDPDRHRSWIVTMVGIQAVDWVATIAYLAAGTVTPAQVTTAAFLPVVFVVILVAGLRRTGEGAVHTT